MMDICYIVGSESAWKNNELRYSLRSVHKFLIGYRNIIIVGNCPDFINKKKIIHIPFPDAHGKNKNWNIYEKIKTAFNYPGISEDIFVMHDDHYMLQTFNVKKFPYYRIEKNLLSKMKSLPTSDGYRIAIANTWTVLNREKLPIENFNIHCPVVFSKEPFLEIMEPLMWNVTYGYLIKSIYCNWQRIPGIVFTDAKIKNSSRETDITERLSGRPFFSSGEGPGESGINKVMESIFAARSPVEI